MSQPTKYVRLEFEEALNAKKQFLSSELNLLQTAKRVRNYKILRKKEIAVKNKLKTALRILRTKMSSIQTSLPEQEKLKAPKTRIKRIKTQADQNIKQELQDIQDKLAKLGQ